MENSRDRRNSSDDHISFVRYMWLEIAIVVVLVLFIAAIIFTGVAR